MNILTINIVHRGSPAFRAVEAGDLDELRRLSGQGLASPTDCIPYEYGSGSESLIEVGDRMHGKGLLLMGWIRSP